MRTTTSIVSVALAALLLASCPAPGSFAADVVPVERPGRLDTFGIGTPGLKKKTPTVEHVGIKREGASEAVVVSRKDPLVMITEPSAGEVSRSVQRVSGNVGSGIAKAFLRINDDTRIVPVMDGRFEALCALRPGLNSLTVLGWDLEGNLGKNSMKVFYRPASGGPDLRITAPVDGTLVDITEDRVVRVKAESSDPSISEAYLVVNNIPRKVRLVRGVLEQDLPLLPGINEIFIEASGPGGKSSASYTTRVHTFDARPKDLVAVLTWDRADTDLDLHVWDSFGHHTFSDAKDPLQCDPAIPDGMLDMDRKGEYGPEVFSLEAAESEVYTFFVKYSPGVRVDQGAGATLSLLLYGNEPTRRIMRTFGPEHLGKASPSWEAAHVKMPEGVFFQEKDADLKKTLGMDSRAVRRLSLVIKEENISFGLLAISALGQIKSEEAVPALVDALSRGPVEIRRAAAGALWNIRSVNSTDSLIQALTDSDPDVRRAAAGALGSIGDTKAVQSLAVLLSDEGDPQVRLEVIRSLGLLGDSKALETIASQAVDTNPAIRVEAVRALGGLKGSDEVTRLLVDALGDSTGRVRELAAWSLGRLKAAGAVRELMDLLYFDDDEGVRVQAAVALGKMGDQEAIKELAKAADKDYSPRVRYCASRSIVELTPTETSGGYSPPPKIIDDDLVVY